MIEGMSASIHCTSHSSSSLTEVPQLMVVLIVNVQKGLQFKIALHTCMQYH